MDRLLSVKSSSQLGQAASVPSTECSLHLNTFNSDAESVVIDEEEDKENIAEPFVKEEVETTTLEIINDIE